MIQSQASIEFQTYPPEKQGRGAFDGGRITEIKPISFPGEWAKPRHLGPLFYWAWASAKGPGKIGLHPHRGFEIMSYVLQGEIGHRDTLGTVSHVRTGGAQVMQTGSGVSHEEETLGSDTQFFQIWFDPNLQEAIHHLPTYREFRLEDFPVYQTEGITIKHVIGEGAPVSLVAPVSMQEVTIPPGAEYHRILGAGQTLAAVTITGEGTWRAERTQQEIPVQSKDFTVIHAGDETVLSIKGKKAGALRLAIIEVPAQVGYPLYGETA